VILAAAGETFDGVRPVLTFVAHWWSFGVLAVVVVAAAVADLKTARIYNVITYPAAAAGLIGHALVGGLTGTDDVMGLAGAAAGLAMGSVLILAWLAGGIGGGDVKLMAAVGALMGWRFTLSAMFWGFLVAALMAVIVMIRKRIVLRTLGRIWRFVILAFTPGKPASPAMADSPKIPFGLALCIGSAISVAEALLGGPGAQKLLLGI
jgi:prepilin peptidase CpaA